MLVECHLEGTEERIFIDEWTNTSGQMIESYLER